MAVDQPRNAERICVLQLGGQSGIGEALVAHWPDKTIDGTRTDRRAAAITRRGKGPAVHHRVTDLDSSRITIEDNAPHPAADHLHQIIDRFALFYMGLVFAASAVVALLSYGYLARRDHIFSAMGMSLRVGEATREAPGLP